MTVPLHINARAGPAGTSVHEQSSRRRRPFGAQLVATEHWSLVAARGMTRSEVMSRITAPDSSMDVPPHDPRAPPWRHLVPHPDFRWPLCRVQRPWRLGCAGSEVGSSWLGGYCETSDTSWPVDAGEMENASWSRQGVWRSRLGGE